MVDSLQLCFFIFFVLCKKVSFELTSTSLDFIDVGYEFLTLVHMHLLLVWIELVNIQIFSVWVQFFKDPNFDV